MNAQFFDREDQKNARNGTTVSEAQVLLSWLDELRRRPPFFCELVGEHGFNLLLGISETHGCAQYSAADGSPPYLMAVGEETECRDEFMEFLFADTDTPVPMKFCLPMDKIKDIAADFIATGQRSATVQWEEI